MKRWHRSLVVFLLTAGCSSSGEDYVPVSGQIKMKGEGVAHLSVTFQPVASGGNVNPGLGSYGTTDATGHYSLKVIGKDVRGAVVGKHKVHIIESGAGGEAQDELPKDAPRLPKSGQPKVNTIFDFEVPAKGTQSADFDIK